MSTWRWQPVFVGVGSNLDNPLRHARQALEELGNLEQTSLVLTSLLYNSDPVGPVGPVGQSDYVNAVAGMLTQLAPLEFLDALQAIEHAHHRDRSGERWSARTLDLDILAYSNEKIESERLTVPHKELHNRNFVLGPWMDIAPDFTVVGLGTVRQLARRVDLGTLRVL